MDIFKKILEHFETFNYTSLYLKINHEGVDYKITLQDQISGRKIYFCVYVNGEFKGKWKKGTDPEGVFFKPTRYGHYLEHTPTPKTYVSYLKKTFKPEQIELIES